MELNPVQRSIVAHREGPALVIAGPGSGKTRTVVERTAALLSEGVPATEITLVTFTKKAAQEMSERLTQKSGAAASGVLALTFHSLAYRILKDSREQISVLPADEAKTLLEQLMNEAKVPRDIGVRQMQGAISRVKNTGEGIEGLIRLYPDWEPHGSKIWEAYHRKLKEGGLADFDDLLALAVEDLQAKPNLLQRWQKRTHWLTIDEYQDTNFQQFTLVQTLLTPPYNLMVVGDPNQAIYSWRGANYRLILEFKEHFPQAQIYRLGVNYRSGGGIVQAAQDLIRNNQEREELVLEATQEGPLPTRVSTENRLDEALFVAEALRYHHDRGVPYPQMAVLLRSLSLSQPLEAVLGRFGVPYTIVGGLSFWKRREVKFYLSLLEASLGKREAKVQVLSSLVPRMGPVRAERALASGKYPKEAGPALALLQDLSQVSGLLGRKLAESVDRILDAHYPTLSPFLLELAEGDPEGADDRWSTLLEAAQTLYTFAEHTPQGDLKTYLNDILLEGQENEEDPGETVRIMTLHASKGLEFDVVFLPFLVDGLLPNGRAARKLDGLEEERRLLYVGITRARKEAYLSYHEFSERGYARPSRFLEEIPATDMDYDKGVGFHGEQTQILNTLAELF